MVHRSWSFYIFYRATLQEDISLPMMFLVKKRALEAVPEDAMAIPPNSAIAVILFVCPRSVRKHRNLEKTTELQLSFIILVDDDGSYRRNVVLLAAEGLIVLASLLISFSLSLSLSRSLH